MAMEFQHEPITTTDQLENLCGDLGSSCTRYFSIDLGGRLKEGKVFFATIHPGSTDGNKVFIINLIIIHRDDQTAADRRETAKPFCDLITDNSIVKNYAWWHWC